MSSEKRDSRSFIIWNEYIMLSFRNQSQLLRVPVHCGYHKFLHSSCWFLLTCTHFDDTSMIAAYIIVAFTRYITDMKEFLCNC